MIQEARIRNIAFYLIKSCAGLEVDRARLTRSGLVVNGYSDHQFMVVSDDPRFIEANKDKEKGVYNFVTQRDRRSREDSGQGLSVMALVKPELAEDQIRLSWNYQDHIWLPPNKEGEVLTVKVWDDVCQALDQGDQYAQWFSDHLGMHVRLAKAMGPFSRKARQDYVRNGNDVKFHDAYPVLWFSGESITELSERAGEDIPWTRFRPQVVVKGVEPQYEHRVQSGEISGIQFLNAKPCDRCPIIQVDQESGVVSGKDPWHTLLQYKKWRKPNGNVKPIFGENMLPLGEGEISIGDPFVVTSLRDPPLVYGTEI